MPDLIDIVGVGAALCSMGSFTPQIIKILKEGDASSISLPMYIVTVTAFVLWTAYGALIGSWPVIVSNVVCLMLSGIILEMVCRLKGRGSAGGGRDNSAHRSWRPSTKARR